MAAPGGPPPADVIRAVQSYITKILRPKDPSKAVSGLRALLLDSQTKTAVSMAYSMHDVLSRDVYLVEDLGVAAGLQNLTHLAAIVLVRPTAENVRVLLGHLREPRFREYHIFFTNIVTQDILRKLADADASLVVKQVQEFYVDFFPVNPDLFSLNLGGSLSLSRPRASYSVHESAAFVRTTQGLLAALLALKLKPYVRFQASSEAAQALARELTGTMSGERDLFTFQRSTTAPPLLLVLDRREDPVTPLLSQWTYQAMVHELLPGGIRNNTVDLKGVKGISKDLE
jgi:vacuolar protein sorting-associated protein 45